MSLEQEFIDRLVGMTPIGLVSPRYPWVLQREDQLACRTELSEEEFNSSADKERVENGPHHIYADLVALSGFGDETIETIMLIQIIKRRCWLRRRQESNPFPTSYMSCALVVSIDLVAIQNYVRSPNQDFAPQHSCDVGNTLQCLPFKSSSAKYGFLRHASSYVVVFCFHAGLSGLSPMRQVTVTFPEPPSLIKLPRGSFHAPVSLM